MFRNSFKWYFMFFFPTSSNTGRDSFPTEIFLEISIHLFWTYTKFRNVGCNTVRLHYFSLIIFLLAANEGNVQNVSEEEWDGAEKIWYWIVQCSNGGALPYPIPAVSGPLVLRMAVIYHAENSLLCVLL